MSRNWNALLSRRAPSLHGWVKMDVNQIFETPDVIYFGDGAPAKEQWPVERLRQAHADAWEEAYDILSYGESLGHDPLRKTIAERMAARGADVDPESVLVTNGSQQGLDLVSRALFDPGDIVVVEGPTYFGALQAFDAYEVDYRVAPMDDHGIVPELLEPLLFTDPRPKAIYTVPTFQNPTGVTLPPERSSRTTPMATSTSPASRSRRYGRSTLKSSTLAPSRRRLRRRYGWAGWLFHRRCSNLLPTPRRRSTSCPTASSSGQSSARQRMAGSIPSYERRERSTASSATTCWRRSIARCPMA
jgi:hypothetical protein